MPAAVEASPQMWLTLLLTGIAVVAYAWERLPIELSSIGILGALLLLFDLMPLAGNGAGALPPEQLLTGFGNPALIAVAALLAIGVNSTAAALLVSTLVTSATSRNNADSTAAGGAPCMARNTSIAR